VSTFDSVDPNEHHRDADKSPSYCGKLQPVDPSRSGPSALASELSPLLSDPAVSSKQKRKRNQRSQCNTPKSRLKNFIK